MCLQPKHASSGGCINAGLVPPDGFIPAAMHLTVMTPAQRNRKLVADLPAKRRRLGKAQIVSIGGPTTADQTRLLSDRFDVLSVANPPRRRQGKNSLVNGHRPISTAAPPCPQFGFRRIGTLCRKGREP